MFILYSVLHPLKLITDLIKMKNLYIILYDVLVAKHCNYIIFYVFLPDRQRKLQETLLAVQQLDVSMSNLRKWLANMEDQLSAPVVYQDCDRKEIQRKLQLQSVSVQNCIC